MLEYFHDAMGDILMLKIFYNQIYMAHLGEAIGSEQEGDRPVLIVDSYKTSTVCVAIPITLQRMNDSKDYHVDLNNGMGTALVEQIRAISKERIYSVCRINNKYATIDQDDWDRINQQLFKICRLKPLREV
jgi:mRNA-degrading endonuclease toxin of MazEF toxin-antitoxin module